MRKEREGEKERLKRRDKNIYIKIRIFEIRFSVLYHRDVYITMINEIMKKIALPQSVSDVYRYMGFLNLSAYILREKKKKGK